VGYLDELIMSCRVGGPHIKNRKQNSIPCVQGISFRR